jgi:hypothetical protein
MSDVALQVYLERLISEADKRYTERFRLADEAVAKAERTMNERLNSMNEFREALKDQSNKMATRLELDTIGNQVEELRRDKSNLDGRLAVVSALISFAVSAAIILVSKFLK